MESYNRNRNGVVDNVTVVKSVQTNPSYKERIAAGIPLKDLPYSLSINKSLPQSQGLKIVYSDGTVQLIKPTSVYMTDNDIGYQRIVGKLASRMQALEDHKSNKLLSKIKGQSLSLIMMYKERHQTGGLVLGFLDKSIDFTRKVKKRDFIGAIRSFGGHTENKQQRQFEKWCQLMYPKRHPKRGGWKAADKRARNVGAAWLQARFAWMPLYMDIEDSLKAAAEQEKKLNSFHQRVGSKFDFNVSWYDGIPGLTCGNDFCFEGTRTGHFGMQVRYSISDATLSTVSSIMNPAAVAWDAVPWSFVIDRVVDISTYLDLYDATVGTSFTTGCSSLFYEDTIIGPPIGSVSSFYPDFIRRNAAGGCTYYLTGSSPRSRHDVRMTRSILSSFPTPKLEYPMRNSLILGTDLVFLGLQLRKKLADRM